MEFAVGYQKPGNGESFSQIVGDYREVVGEVYFPWPGMASGRMMLGRTAGVPDWSSQEELLEELKAIRALGKKLDILFNANCYGGKALSASLMKQVCSVLDYLGERDLLPEIATTTSPFVASVIRRFFPQVEIRASVNMRIEGTLGMDYLSDLFDSFYIRRDLQRDLTKVRVFRQWCDDHGKKLCMLANSGCLRNCPAQSFHDNLVAHDAEIEETKNVTGYQPHLCWRLYGEQHRYEEILRASWIRPEDLKYYEGYFDVVKLATRQHSHPRMVLGAYASRHFQGNLLDLLEPAFSSAFAPNIIDNGKFPTDWHEIATGCANFCTHCGKCEGVLKEVLVRLPEGGFPER